MEVVISDSESISDISLMVRQCGFYDFMSLVGLKGKLAMLFWESTPQNVLYSTWRINAICQIDKNMVNEHGNVLVTNIKMAGE